MQVGAPIRFLLVACLSLSAVLSARGPAERILDYHSDITLEDDGSLQVTETITVNSTGRHVYTITYTTNRQLGSYKDHDELFWNVTGNGWDFPIDAASATVHLPLNIPADKVTLSGFTGPKGSRESRLATSNDAAGFEFAAQRSLVWHEGLSVLLQWPKGYITPPTFSQNLEFFFRDNRGALLLGPGFLVTLLYYLIAWSAVGRDPARGVIMALYEPPANLSPSAMRYLMRMGYDNKTFAAAILDMAVRGF